jgi:iron complex transport system substrate-binding protein
MRIVSLSPAGAEIVCALGLRTSLAGRSHNCDFPADVLDLPAVDVTQAAALQPDIVITDADGNGAAWPANVRVITLNPATIEDILQSILVIGEATRTTSQATALVQSLRGRLDRVHDAVAQAVHRPTVAALAWLAPPFTCGHWVPEQIEIAGGRSMLGEAEAPAQQIDWDDVIGSQAEMVVIMPRDKDIAGSVQAFIDVADLDVWRDLPATYLWQLYAVDASAYFSRPGPRVVDGVEILAGMIQPHLWPAPGPAQALRVNDVLQTQMRVDKNRRLRLE